MLKLSAVFAALLYGLLFLGYLSYYSHLNISPEDVGVTNSFLFVRSIGFIFLMLCVAAATGLTHFFSLRHPSSAGTSHTRLRAAARVCVGLGLGLYTVALVPDSWPAWAAWLTVLAPVLVAGASAALTNSGRKKVGITLLLALGTTLALVVPTIAVVSQGLDKAQQALRGEPVAPFSVLGIPVLDVSATPVTVSWVGPAGQQPAAFGPTPGAEISGLYLGNTAQAVLLVHLASDGSRTRLSLPAVSVAVEDR